MKNTDKELEKAAGRMLKGTAPKAKKEPTPKGKGVNLLAQKNLLMQWAG